jgi:hypothetical protein
MTEGNWRNCNGPLTLLMYLHTLRANRSFSVSDRKLRLFAVACCRRIGHTLKADRFQRVIEIVERVADGLATQQELRQAAATVYGGDHSAVQAVVHTDAYRAAERTAEAAAQWAGFVADWTGSSYPAGQGAELIAQSALLRELFDNPFRPSGFSPMWLAWHDGIVPRLAEAIYEERAFERLPILGDALEDAGCTNQTILDHCRQTGAHVRGCWVLDGVLAKE